MPASMTGFGRASLEAPSGTVTIEIQSINRKFLDISVFLPREFSQFELSIRKSIAEIASRGQVVIRLHLTPKFTAKLLPDPKFLHELKTGWEKIAKELDLDPKSIDLPFLMLNFPVQQKLETADDADLGTIEKCMKEASSFWIQMKLKEGKALADDLARRLSFLERQLKEIEQLAPNAALRMKERLMEKMGEMLKESGNDWEERILRESLLYAERIDISEEITRLKSHFVQFEEILHQKANAVGRKMEFLIQEIGREINTIGSKSAEAKISHLVIDMKSELEKMREQVQNIE